MNGQSNVIEALDLVPGWDPGKAVIEELKGGLTNRVFHVRANDRECVLRLAKDDTDTFDLDRACELAILEAASDAGIAPAVLYADERAGILMTEYLHGRVWRESDLESEENLESLAALLRRVHALPACCSPLDLTAIAGKYRENLQERHGLHAFASRCVEIVSNRPLHEHIACCHNDIVAENVLDSGGLKLIDWEYASDNDPMFDLASAIGFHNFDEERQHVLLSAYAGSAAVEYRERLDDQVRVFDAIQWLWLANRHLVSPSKDQARRLEELQQRIR